MSEQPVPSVPVPDDDLPDADQPVAPYQEPDSLQGQDVDD